jgi:hypothetical protein
LVVAVLDGAVQVHLMSGENEFGGAAGFVQVGAFPFELPGAT